MKTTDILFFMNIFSGMGFSILSPLFPLMGLKNGFSESLIGWVIGIFALSSTSISPFTPLLIKKFTRIKLLYYATFCEATSTLLYGIISFINSFYGILIFMFIIRIIHGCCCGIVGTLVFSLTISLSEPSKVQKSLGNLEIGWCIGITAGPLFASIFYKIGGYYLPFIILGSFLYTSVFLSTRIAKEKTESDEEIKDNPPFLKYMGYGEIIFVLGLFLAGYISQSFYYPCLTNHLKTNFGLSVSASSLFFIIIAISNAITLQFLDTLTEKIGSYGTSCIGLLIIAFGVLMIYPYPPIPKNIIFVIIGFILIGVGGVPVFIPGLVALKENIKKIDPKIHDLTVNDITSAINFLTVNIGDFCGPIVGGFFTTHFGFKRCCLIVSCIIVFYFIFYFFYFHKSIINAIKKKEILDTQIKTDENELINHPGIYKNNNIEDIISSNNEYNNFGMRKNAISGLKFTEGKNEPDYIGLEDKN